MSENPADMFAMIPRKGRQCAPSDPKLKPLLSPRFPLPLVFCLHLVSSPSCSFMCEGVPKTVSCGQTQVTQNGQTTTIPCGTTGCEAAACALKTPINYTHASSGAVCPFPSSVLPTDKHEKLCCTDLQRAIEAGCSGIECGLLYNYMKGMRESGGCVDYKAGDPNACTQTAGWKAFPPMISISTSCCHHSLLKCTPSPSLLVDCVAHLLCAGSVAGACEQQDAKKGSKCMTGNYVMKGLCGGTEFKSRDCYSSQANAAQCMEAAGKYLDSVMDPGLSADSSACARLVSRPLSFFDTPLSLHHKLR